MTTFRCPGQDMRKLRVELFKCPNCGADVEIFSDEQSVRCQKCREKIVREQTPTCIEWCASARQCLGEDRWKAVMGDRGEKTDIPSKKDEGVKK